MFAATLKSTLASSRALRNYATKPYTDALMLLKTDLKASMRSKDTLTRDTIKSLLATIKNKELETEDSKLSEFLLFETFQKSMKQRNDSATEYKKLERPDLEEKELKEAQVIEKYLKQLPVASEEDVKRKVDEFLSSVGENKKVGEVLKLVNWEEVRETWKADEKLVKRLIAQGLKK